MYRFTDEDGPEMDYAVIAECEYEVEDRRVPDGVGGCREPATHYVWWLDYKDKVPVCQEHFEFMKKCEGIK